MEHDYSDDPRLAHTKEYLGMAIRRVRAAAYVRVSDMSKADSITIESQLDAIRSYCKMKGYILEEEYIFMEAISAMFVPYWLREKLTVLLNTIRGNIDVVAVHSFSRLSRQQVDQIVIGDKIKKEGARLESVTENYDDSAIGQYVRHTYAFASQLEVEKMKERIDRGRRKKAQHGLLGQGAPLYGYQFADLKVVVNGKVNILKNGRYEYNDKESVAVERMALLADEGMSNRQIAITLTNEGFKPRKGNVWSQATVSQKLRDPIYTGKGYVFRSIRTDELTKKYRRKAIRIPQEEWVSLPEGIVPPIIPLEQFERIQERLQDNKNYSTRRSSIPPKELLRCGHAICGKCGGKMHVQRYETLKKGRKMGRDNEYFCRKPEDMARNCEPHTISISAPKLDAMAWKVAVEHINDPSLVEKRVKELREENKLLGDAENIRKKLAELKKKSDRLAGLVADCSDDDMYNSLRSRMKEIEKEQRGLKQILSKIEREDENREKVQEQIDKFENFARNFQSLMESGFEPPYEMKVEAIRMLGLQATVYPGREHRVKFEIVPSHIVNAALHNPTHNETRFLPRVVLFTYYF